MGFRLFRKIRATGLRSSPHNFRFNFPCLRFSKIISKTLRQLKSDSADDAGPLTVDIDWLGPAPDISIWAEEVGRWPGAWAGQESDEAGYTDKALSVPYPCHCLVGRARGSGQEFCERQGPEENGWGERTGFKPDNTVTTSNTLLMACCNHGTICT